MGLRTIPSVHDYLRVDPGTGIPLAAQLHQQLTWLIASGHLPQGAALPPIRQLADSLGINLHTVRAAYQRLQADGLVEIRRGRRATILPYDRQRQAERSPDLPTFTIGILVPNYSPYHARFLEGLQEATQHDPWLLFVCETDYYRRYVRRTMDQLVAKGVDGIIVTHFETPQIAELREALTHAGRLPPIVYADSLGMPGPSVVFDRAGGGVQATRHLIEHGHRRVAFITPPLDWSSMKEVHRGYRRALEESGRTVEPDLLQQVSSFSLEEGEEAGRRLLDLASPPTAILATGDILAIGAMQAIRARGLRVPHDIAVVGFGEIDFAHVVDPPLTTVSLPAERMGMEAMTMLRQRIAGEEVRTRPVRLDVELVIRRSCGCGHPHATPGGEGRA